MAKKKRQNLITRPPVVVVVGHIDHGKTTLLDSIRKTQVAEKETGGITQHIGAYEILHQGKKITFIDTPGHEAFSAMRSRGAKVADIAVLVVDATEGVKPQTKEAISHIKKAEIQTIVALNKMDRPQANPEKVKKELEKAGVQVESLGGKIPSVEVAAKTGQGIKDLLELILLVAEMENLKTEISTPGKGVVIEAFLDAKRGPTATLLLKAGQLKKGDIVGTQSALGKIKILEDFQENAIDEAVPSMPVIVLGFEQVPQVGEMFQTFTNLEGAQKNIVKKEEKGVGEVILVEEGKKVLNLILKTDVLGSLGAIEEVLRNLPQEKVIMRILVKGVGKINEGDVKLAKSGRARILGFRVGADAIAKKLAERDNIKILTFDIIYDLVQAARSLMEKMREPEIVRQDLGKIKILVVFKRDKNRQIVGGKVMEGEVAKRTMAEILRPGHHTLQHKAGGGEEKIGKGKLINLQKNKKDIERGVRGDEVGILYEGQGIIEEGDVLVIYKEERKKANSKDN